MVTPSQNGRGRLITQRNRVRIDTGIDGGAVKLGRAVPGRVFVTLAVLGLLVLWGVLYLAFWLWRAEARERIAFGKEQVAPVVEPMAEIQPPGVPIGEWRKAVAATRERVEEVTGTGRLDIPALSDLRDVLVARVEAAQDDPEHAVEAMAAIWEELARYTRVRAEIERPEILPPPRPSKPSNRDGAGG